MPAIVRQKTRFSLPLLGDQVLLLGTKASGGGGTGLDNRLEQLAYNSVRRTRIWLDQTYIDVAAANDYGSCELCLLPNADIKILAAKIKGGNGTPTGGGVVLSGFASNAGSALDVSIGTAAASNATLSGTMVDVLQKLDGTDVIPGVGNVNGFTDKSTSGVVISAGASNKLYLNVADPVTAGTATAAFVACYVDIHFMYLGA